MKNYPIVATSMMSTLQGEMDVTHYFSLKTAGGETALDIFHVHEIWQKLAYYQAAGWAQTYVQQYQILIQSRRSCPRINQLKGKYKMLLFSQDEHCFQDNPMTECFWAKWPFAKCKGTLAPFCLVGREGRWRSGETLLHMGWWWLVLSQLQMKQGILTSVAHSV